MTEQIPDIKDIAAQQLIVDHSVQRSLDSGRVHRMAVDYQANAIGAIVVNHRTDGTFHVVDGQHRVAATLAAGYGDKELTCLVYHGLSKAEEAGMFRRLNNSRAVQALDKFRVRVVEGEQVAVLLNNILARNGWTVAQSKDDGAFAAVSAFENLYRTTVDQPAQVCDLLLQVITSAWSHNADGVRAEIVSGVGAVLARHHNEIDLAKVTHELAEFSGGARGLIGKARSLRDIRGGRIGDAMAEIVIGLVNKNRRVNRLPAWRED